MVSYSLYDMLIMSKSGFFSTKSVIQALATWNGCPLQLSFQLQLVLTRYEKDASLFRPNHSNLPSTERGPVQAASAIVAASSEIVLCVPVSMQFNAWPTTLRGSKLQNPGAAMMPS